MANNPPPPYRSPVVDANGMLTDIWVAFFTSFFAASTSGTLTGEVKLYTSDQVPLGWLLCDGSELNRVKYANLFSVVGTKFGAGDGSTTFNLPNPSGKYIRSGDIGATGGQDTYTLILDNLPHVSLEVIDPGHTHTFDPVPHHHTITDPEHNHSFTADPHHHTVGTGAGAGGVTANGTGGTVDTSVVTVTGVIGNSATGITVDDATATGTNETAETGIEVNLLGESAPISLDPPYVNFAFIIKY